MSLFSRLFPCRACEAREAEIARLESARKWLQDQVDLQNRRLVEIADPRANERLVQADRLSKRPVSGPTRAAPSAGLPPLPGTEPAAPRDWEVDEAT